MKKLLYIVPFVLIVGLLYGYTHRTIHVGAVPVGTLPNATLTPGVTNPGINQGNISQNICNKGWSTKSIRPTSAYTTALKKKQIVQYGYADTATASYEEDHLISLELGGNPTDPKNLWPEAYPMAHTKDSVENQLHAQVCAGTLTLAAAQKIISTNWYAFYQKTSGNVGGVVSDPDDEQ